MKSKTIIAAINLGFSFESLDQDLLLEEVNQLMMDFLSENSGKIELVEEHECEVTSSGRTQNVNFGDYTSSGEIIDWYSYRFSERKKIFHSDFVGFNEDGTPVLIKLWCWSKNEEIVND